MFDKGGTELFDHRDGGQKGVLWTGRGRPEDGGVSVLVVKFPRNLTETTVSDGTSSQAGAQTPTTSQAMQASSEEAPAPNPTRKSRTLQ
jgi:hypothetical protein